MNTTVLLEIYFHPNSTQENLRGCITDRERFDSPPTQEEAEARAPQTLARAEKRDVHITKVTIIEIQE